MMRFSSLVCSVLALVAFPATGTLGQRVQGYSPPVRGQRGDPASARLSPLDGSGTYDRELRMMMRRTMSPTKRPTRRRRTMRPTKKPSARAVGTGAPSASPSSNPTPIPTPFPTPTPTTPAPSVSPSASPAPSSSPTGEFCSTLLLNQDNGHRYFLGPTNMDITAAIEYVQQLPKCCDGQVAHLVTVSDEGEDTFLHGMLPNPGSKGLLGLTYENGFAEWINGESLSDYVAGLIESLGLYGDCTYLVGQSAGFWSRESCDAATSKYVVVEYDCAA